MGLRRTVGVSLLVIGAAGILTSVGVAAATVFSPYQFYFDEFRESQETALIQKFQKSEDPILEEIFKAQNFEIKYDAKTHTFGDSVSAISALEKVCNTAEFAQQPVCKEYSQIPAKVAAQAQINSKYQWMPYTMIGLVVGASLTGLVGALLLLSSPYKPKESLPAT